MLSRMQVSRCCCDGDEPPDQTLFNLQYGQLYTVFGPNVPVDPLPDFNVPVFGGIPPVGSTDHYLDGSDYFSRGFIASVSNIAAVDYADARLHLEIAKATTTESQHNYSVRVYKDALAFGASIVAPTQADFIGTPITWTITRPLAFASTIQTSPDLSSLVNLVSGRDGAKYAIFLVEPTGTRDVATAPLQPRHQIGTTLNWTGVYV